MRRFKNILFLADGSKGENSALSGAAKLASTNRAKLTILDTIELEEYSAIDPETMSVIKDERKIQIQERMKGLEHLCSSLVSKHPGLKVAAGVDTGNLALVAIRAVLAKHHDLVIKVTEGGSGKLKFLFGGIDRRLMRKCPCPVWIIKPSRKKRIRRILAAVDLNQYEPEAQSLAEQIIALSTSLAKDNDSELHVVHAWRLAGESRMRGRQISKEHVDKILQEIEETSQAALDRLVQHHPYKKRKIHLIKGRADDVIPKMVEGGDIDLVVIGTVGRSGIPGLLIGNTAEKILNTIECSVFTLKPEGFETPIQL